MSIEKEEMQKAFQKVRKEESYKNPQHFEDCGNIKSNVPIDECSCNCFEKRIFEIGFKKGSEVTFDFIQGKLNG